MDFLDLAADTVAYYSSKETFAVAANGQCQYRTEDGKMCAVGRWLDPVKLEQNGLTYETLNSYGVIGDLDDILDDRRIRLNDILKDEVSHISQSEWKALQSYHDSIAHWLPRKDEAIVDLAIRTGVTVSELKKRAGAIQ
jgi:hypothetical protein